MMIREAYAQAAQLFVDTVARVRDTQWDSAGLGEWSVRDLVGHTNRALLTVETYLDKPAVRVDLMCAMDYFVQAKASLADPVAVAARGREAGKALGADPLHAVRTTAERVLARVNTTPDTTCVGTPVGGMRLIDYLPSRVFELTIHTLDLAAATSQDVTIAREAAIVTVSLVTELAQASGKLAPLLLAATGRRALPSGFSVL
jgi:uncharacterized protein (TIGR03083 family)